MSNPGNMTYDESDEHRVGAIRRSSATNELLIKPKLGTVKRPTRDIPEESFSYGIMNEQSDGVREAMVHQEHIPNPHATKGQDIRAMNKQAPKMKVVRAHQQRQYRRENPLKLKVKQRISSGAPLPSQKDPEYVYGKPLIRGESAEELMTYNYADDWIKMNQYHQHNYGFMKPQFVPLRTTKTVEVRSETCYQKYNPPSPRERFVISRFKTVPHKIDNVQTTPLLRDERPPVFKTSKRRGGIFGAAAREGDDTPSCAIAMMPRTRPVCSGPKKSGPEMSNLLPRRGDDMYCVPEDKTAPGKLLPRHYQSCSTNPDQTCATHPRRSDPDVAFAPVRREVTLRGPRRSDPD